MLGISKSRYNIYGLPLFITNRKDRNKSKMIYLYPKDIREIGKQIYITATKNVAFDWFVI